MEVYEWGSTMKFAGYEGKTDAEDRQVSWYIKSVIPPELGAIRSRARRPWPTAVLA
jgi:hypothetical protein